jgi:hypothetical protein
MTRAVSLRASDADREKVSEHLRQATIEGRLTTDELEERLGALPAARTYGELEALVRDLPVSRSPAKAPARFPTWIGVAAAVPIALVFLGVIARAGRHFGETERGFSRASGGVHQLLIAAASMGLVFIAVAVICGTVLWRWLRSRHPSRR